MFILNQSDKQKNKYLEMLQSLGAMSKLFSDSPIPYLYYRTAENAFCLAFNADNLSRGDTSVDAKVGSLGIGLKTFLNTKNNESYQKIAEFNKTRKLYSDQINNPENLIKIIAELRNTRIQATKDIHGLDATMYHSIIRDKGEFFVAEESMEFVNIETIKNVKRNNENSIYFNDSKSEYLFNISKSTLFKRFHNKAQISFPIKIFENPFDILEVLYSEKNSLLEDSKNKYLGIIYLPLYSEKGIRHVPEKSGLNQWNAGGRERNEREVYIPIPAWIHKHFPDFFPARDTPFSLKLPNGNIINAKVCQEGSKALMSNPNEDLGKWLLNDVIKLKPGKIVTIDLLDAIGVDSVEVRKVNKTIFEIDFKETGTFDDFKEDSNE